LQILAIADNMIADTLIADSPIADCRLVPRFKHRNVARHAINYISSPFVVAF